eukprot:TRINITY_DN954_c0_g3_i1.p1 TRINITY_DN954_c0_g3~~TRINITY_DN954_c0_g3_i1.p1  ORF type:complete len:385 (-),score=151.99 TRINITY_DN954_c0_g3_i1:318-1472(-)
MSTPSKVKSTPRRDQIRAFVKQLERELDREKVERERLRDVSGLYVSPEKPLGRSRISQERPPSASKGTPSSSTPSSQVKSVAKSSGSRVGERSAEKVGRKEEEEEEPQKGMLTLSADEVDSLLLRIVTLEEKVKLYDEELHKERKVAESALREAEKDVLNTMEKYKVLLEENATLKGQLHESLTLNARLYQLLEVSAQQLQRLQGLAEAGALAKQEEEEARKVGVVRDEPAESGKRERFPVDVAEDVSGDEDEDGESGIHTETDEGDESEEGAGRVTHVARAGQGSGMKEHVEVDVEEGEEEEEGSQDGYDYEEKGWSTEEAEYGAKLFMDRLEQLQRENEDLKTNLQQERELVAFAAERLYGGTDAMPSPLRRRFEGSRMQKK